MKDYIEERTLEEAKYIISSRSTVRDTSKIFGVSKSTVFKDVTERLPMINHNIALKVREVLQINLNERHMRGGMATKTKFGGCYNGKH